MPVYVIQLNKEFWPFESRKDPSEIIPEINSLISSDTRIVKRANSAFRETELRSLLEKSEIHNLVICGMWTNKCVKSTLRDAIFFQYECEIAEDAHIGRNPGIIQRWNRRFKKQAAVLPAKEIRF
jgi:nicotinamidase-related amidase